MRLSLISTLALLQAFIMFYQRTVATFQALLSCEERAMQIGRCHVAIFQAQTLVHKYSVDESSGMPTDGWKVVLGDVGQPDCHRVAVQVRR